MLEGILFWVFSMGLMLSSLGVIISKNLFRSAVYLVFSLTFTSLLFLLLKVEFLAFLQILLYAGGVAVLLVFAIMVTRVIVGKDIWQQSRGLGWGILFGLIFVGIGFGFFKASSHLNFSYPKNPHGVKEIGEVLFTRFFLPFEILSLLIVAGIIGALLISRKD